MHVNIDEIKEGGLERAWELPREAVDEIVRGDGAGFRASSPFRVEARLQKVQDRVLLSAEGRASLTVPCGRCLVSVEIDLPVAFELTFVPEGSDIEAMGAHGQHDIGHVGGSFDLGDADEEKYKGKVIDLDPVVREQLLLALPSYPVCREDCKGLCSVCGANLNERNCGCDRHVPDPRWAGLEKLKRERAAQQGDEGSKKK